MLFFIQQTRSDLNLKNDFPLVFCFVVQISFLSPFPLTQSKLAKEREGEIRRREGGEEIEKNAQKLPEEVAAKPNHGSSCAKGRKEGS